MEQKHMSGKAALKIVVGSILAAYGLTLAVYAGFGGATLAIFWQGVANLTGLTIGGASLAVAVVMLAFVFLYDRRQIHIGTVIYQLFYSGFVEIFSRLHVYSQSRILNFIIMCARFVVFSFGTGLYSSANLGRGSYEAMTFALAEKNGWPVKYVRMVLDVLMVVLGVLCGGRFGVCTIATIIIAGPIIQWTVQKF